MRAGGFRAEGPATRSPFPLAGPPCGQRDHLWATKFWGKRHRAGVSVRDERERRLALRRCCSPSAPGISSGLCWS